MSPLGSRPLVKIVLMVGLSIPAVAICRGQTVEIIGQDGQADRGEFPVLLPIRAALSPGSYAMEPRPSGSSISAVVFEDGDRRWLAAILPAIPSSGRPLTCDLKPQASNGAGQTAGVRFRPSGDNLDVIVDEALLTTYIPMSNSKPIFFPVIAPSGVPVTRSYPMASAAGEDRDHPHQRSLWFTHGSVNGVDFWAEDRPGTPAEKRTKGFIRELERQVVVQGPVLARLRTRNEWLAPGGRRVCQERRTVTFYHTRSVRIMDLDFKIEATDGPLTFGDTKEGMFGLRVASTMDVTKKKGGKITNAEGLTDGKTWGQASPWVDYVGPVNGRMAGIAILNHPSSFRFPTTWHVRDYGLFAANPFGWKDFGRSTRGDHTVPAGESLSFSYRIILHEGDTASLNVPGYFRGYSRPPEVVVRDGSH